MQHDATIYRDLIAPLSAKIANLMPHYKRKSWMGVRKVPWYEVNRGYLAHGQFRTQWQGPRCSWDAESVVLYLDSTFLSGRLQSISGSFFHILIDIRDLWYCHRVETRSPRSLATDKLSSTAASVMDGRLHRGSHLKSETCSLTLEASTRVNG